MPSEVNPRRLEQVTASFRALGCDNVNYWRDYGVATHPGGRGDPVMKCRASWSDDSGRPPIIVTIVGKEDRITMMVLCGIEMSRRLAEERPELTFPDVVWT